MAAISIRPFGTLPDGRQVKLFIIKDGALTAHVLEYGGILQKLIYQKSYEDGRTENVDMVLGFDTLEEYIRGASFYFGATVGRYANRIKGGRFTLDGKEYELTHNEGPTTLHGGVTGFSSQLFSGRIEGDSVALTLKSPDGEGGFPGNLVVEVRISIKNDALRFDYLYMSDKDTPVSMTHHSYWNLNGEGSGSAADHHLTLNCERYLKLDQQKVSQAPYVKVKNTPFDFTEGKTIAEDLASRAAQMRVGKGYDHCFVVDEDAGGHIGTLVGDKTGIAMRMQSDLPGVQFYDGSGIGQDGMVYGKGGKVYRRRYGVCFEPQFFPNSPNEPYFPSTIAKAGTLCHHHITYAFSVK